MASLPVWRTAEHLGSEKSPAFCLPSFRQSSISPFSKCLAPLLPRSSPGTKSLSTPPCLLQAVSLPVPRRRHLPSTLGQRAHPNTAAAPRGSAALRYMPRTACLPSAAGSTAAWRAREGEGLLQRTDTTTSNHWKKNISVSSHLLATSPPCMCSTMFPPGSTQCSATASRTLQSKTSSRADSTEKLFDG